MKNTILNEIDSCKQHEKDFFAYYEGVWDTLPAKEKQEIENLVDFLMSEHGAICSKYDFIRPRL